MDHASHEAQGEHNCHGEKPCQEGGELSGEGLLDVIHRTAVDGSIGIHLAGDLGQHGLGIVGGHAQEGDDPHPEDSAGSADEDGPTSTYDIAGAHLGGNGGGKRLEGAHAASMAAAMEGDVSKQPPAPFGKASDLNETGFNGEEQTCTNEQE